MRILLAGATGVVGRRLVPLLVGAGHQVTGLTRRPAGARQLVAAGAQAAVVNVYDPDALTTTVRAAAPEVVMHQLTDLSSGDTNANAEIRRRGTRNLVDAALAAGVTRMVAQSISWVYEPGSEPAAEDTPFDLHADEPRRTTVRGVAVLEESVRRMPEWVLLRYGLFYGPDTWHAADGRLATQARTGQLTATGDVSSFVHVDDAVAAAIAALNWPTGPVNVCDDEPAAALDWMPDFCRAVGAPEPRAEQTRQPWARGADNQYARKNLNWTPKYPTWRIGFSHLS
ncbi:NAD-dependent epimerase/dehydratase family protein [Fodinicola acaciae]|uniref:NAD-dependent epimerase/dehydratase family protein n=1 Tax=Fodinicola acaciae TaxID=2681555 RepID=UPI0013D26AB1|nr:NAD(P)-dependent oxidoreductase [Fodinicola acaciae]